MSMSKSKSKTNNKSKITTLCTLTDYKKTLSSARTSNKLVVTKFYASWCRSCKAIEQRFISLSNLYPNVIFVQVEMNDKTRSFVIQGLGIETLPFAHIVHPEAGLVEELRISKSRFKNLEAVLMDYAVGRCSIENSAEGKVLFGELEITRQLKMDKRAGKSEKGRDLEKGRE
ncbi:hypothetical protein ScalyP_jg3764 [Parmales sp. scaly parma]|nr:hypothetical protein ScalyP_jg3764 [Parmales sp. scaly parma]